MARRLNERGLSMPFGASIATTGNTDVYVQADRNGTLDAVFFSSLLLLAASDTNYITFSVTNLGQGGAGTTEMLQAVDANTTKSTGGAALVANAVRKLLMKTTKVDRAVVEGDTIRIRAAVTGTLGGAITVPRVTLLIRANGA